MSDTAQAVEAPWRIGLRGARANLIPGLILQVVALTVALAYYFYAPARGALEQLSDFRVRTGFAYSFIATGIFGGVLPCLYLALQPATRGRYNLKQYSALCGFWAYKGIEVDLLYRLLASTIGTDVSVKTIATKVFWDQFVYCPLIAVPVTVLLYAWVETRFDAGAVWRDLRAPRWYQRRAVPNLISNLGVWLPTVCIVYALPSSLQLPLFNLVLCFFTLLLAHISAQVSPSRRA